MKYRFEIHGGPYGCIRVTFEASCIADAKAWYDDILKQRDESMIADVVIEQQGLVLIIPRDVFDNSIKAIKEADKQ